MSDLEMEMSVGFRISVPINARVRICEDPEVPNRLMVWFLTKDPVEFWGGSGTGAYHGPRETFMTVPEMWEAWNANNTDKLLARQEGRGGRQ